MLDPSESRVSRIARWVFWGLLFAGVIAYASDFDIGRIWGAVGYGLATIAVVFAIQGIVVDPILAKLRDLEYKIDRLGSRRTPLD